MHFGCADVVQFSFGAQTMLICTQNYVIFSFRRKQCKFMSDNFYIKMQFCFQQRKKLDKFYWIFGFCCVPIKLFFLRSIGRLFCCCWFSFDRKNKTDSQKWWNDFAQKISQIDSIRNLLHEQCCINPPLIYRLKCCPSNNLVIILIRRTEWSIVFSQTACFDRYECLISIRHLLKICAWQHNWPFFTLCPTRMQMHTRVLVVTP